MPSRKDQLHSYQFMMQRVISSVMVHETDPEQAPLRRGVGAVFAGVMLTGLVAIGFAVYGVISGNTGDRWRSEGAIVIEKETGAHYVYYDGTLVPALNYASARLLAGSLPQSQEESGGVLGNLFGGGGGDDLEPKQVAGRNLAGIPRTATVGIPGAPDSLPSSGRAVGTPWTMCSVRTEDSAGSPVTGTMLLVGEQPPAGAEPFGDRAMLVDDPEADASYLVWRSHRYRLTGDDPDQLIRSLYGSRAEEVDAGSGWLNGLPSGQDIGPIEVGDFGEPSSVVSDWAVGDVVFHQVADGEQYYLVRDDGLEPLTELQVLLLRGQFNVEPEEVSAALAFTAPSSDTLEPATGETAPPPAPPDLLPVPEEGPVTLCAETTDARSPPQVSLGGDLRETEGALPTGGESHEGARLADWVRVPPGHIAVVRVLPSDTATAGAYQLVTDLGVRFPVPNEEVLGLLGYSAAQAVEMPSVLVQRIPAGPTLSPSAAQQTAPGILTGPGQ